MKSESDNILINAANNIFAQIICINCSRDFLFHMRLFRLFYSCIPCGLNVLDGNYPNWNLCCCHNLNHHIHSTSPHCTATDASHLHWFAHELQMETEKSRRCREAFESIEHFALAFELPLQRTASPGTTTADTGLEYWAGIGRAAIVALN